MIRLLLLPAIAALLVPFASASAEPPLTKLKSGELYELTLTRDMTERDNHGGTGSSHDKDTLLERVVEARADGVVIEYDLWKSASADERASEWRFPARILKRPSAPPELLNSKELAGRVDGWLKRAGLTRASCGHRIFTWNAFRIDCDPQSVIQAVKRFDFGPADIHEGAAYTPLNAGQPALLIRDGKTLLAETPIDVDAVRRNRAEADASVAELMKRPLTIEDALRERARDVVKGKVTARFEDIQDGGALRTTVTDVEVTRPDGRIETQTITETLERRRIQQTVH